MKGEKESVGGRQSQRLDQAVQQMLGEFGAQPTQGIVPVHRPAVLHDR
ncbi:hypothetical protein [Streptomyces sp. NPDC005953]